MIWQDEVLTVSTVLSYFLKWFVGDRFAEYRLQYLFCKGGISPQRSHGPTPFTIHPLTQF